MSSDTSRVTDVVPGASAFQELSTFGKIRLVGFSLVVLAVLGFAAFVLRELFSLLVLGWTADVGAELGIHRLHVMVIATVILTTLLGVAVQIYRPKRQVAAILGAFLSVAAAALIQFIGEGSAGSVVPFLVMIGLATVLHPAGRGLLRRGESYSPAMLALVVAAAIPMLAFAAAQVGLQLNTNDAHAAAGHYTGMAQFGLIPLIYGFLGAMGMRGWRVAAWIAALPVSYYGILAISFPAQAGAAGPMWGGAAVLWAGGFLAVSEYSRFEVSPVLRRSSARES